MTESQATSSPATVLYYNHTGSISGGEIVLLAMLSGLDRSAYKPIVLCPEGPLAMQCRAAGVTCDIVPELHARFTSNPIRLLGYLRNLAAGALTTRRKIKQNAPAIIHANGVRPGIIATIASVGLKTPVIWHLHDILPPHPITTAIRTLVLSSRRTTLIAVSEATAGSFRRQSSALDGRKLSVVYNSIDFDRFRPDPAARVRMRKELGLRDDQIAIGVIGQITLRKGQLELVQAFASISPRIPQAVLFVVGGAMFTDANRAYARTLQEAVDAMGPDSHVRMLGKRDDTPAVVNAMDLLVQNSSVEPLGLAIMEGLATGVPAVASGVDGVREVIEQDVNGLLATPGDIHDLAAKLELLVTDEELRQHMATNARKTMLQKFTLSRQMSLIHAHYREAIDNQGTHPHAAGVTGATAK